MIWDQHMHTHFSGDSQAAPEAMLNAAAEKNLPGVCFTDHFDYDYPKEPDLFMLDFSRSLRETERLREIFRGRLSVCWGVELGLQPHIADINREVAAQYPFDFIIGSSHVVHGADPYYGSFFEGRSEEEACREYFEAVLENLGTDVDFDVYGHLDYIVRYGPGKNRFYSYKKYADLLDEILRTLICRGKGIEVNTGGYRSGLGQPNPADFVLTRYRQLGGEIVTVGSDAHAPEHVAWDFDSAAELLLSCGFTHYTVFCQRNPRFLPL